MRGVPPFCGFIIFGIGGCWAVRLCLRRPRCFSSTRWEAEGQTQPSWCPTVSEKKKKKRRRRRRRNGREQGVINWIQGLREQVLGEREREKARLVVVVVRGQRESLRQMMMRGGTELEFHFVPKLLLALGSTECPLCTQYTPYRDGLHLRECGTKEERRRRRAGKPLVRPKGSCGHIHESWENIFFFKKKTFVEAHRHAQLA